MRSVSRWQGALAATLVSAALGLFLLDPLFFLLATAPLAYVAYGTLSDPDPPALRLERSVSAERVAPGETVAVDLTVTNVGDRTAPDLRVVDGVPADVAVTGGTAAAATALRPEESTTVSYEVTPPRGSHEFDRPTVRARNLAATAAETGTFAPEGATSVTCETLLDDFPARDGTTPLPGRHPTDAGGSGVVFDAVREYRRGDPMGSIDWRHFARTGDLATVEYQEERAASVVFVVDDRPEAACRAPGGALTGTDLSVYAAAHGFMALVEAGDRAGVVSVTAGADAWVDPGRDEETVQAARSLFGERGAATPAVADGGGPAVSADTDADASPEAATDADALAHSLLTWLPGDAAVVFCTPLTDGVPMDVVAALRAQDYPVTLLSPDVTPDTDEDATPGQTRTAIARRTRLGALRRRGVPAVDWARDTPLQVALADAFAAQGRRWDR